MSGFVYLISFGRRILNWKLHTLSGTVSLLYALGGLGPCTGSATEYCYVQDDYLWL